MSEFKKIKLAEIRAIIENKLEEKARNPYAIGMAAAKKAAHDEPPLKKSTIVKGHEIAKKIMNKEEAEDLEELSKKTLASYIPAAAKDAERAGAHQEYFGHDDDFRAGKNRQKGIERAVKRLAKEESGETYDTTTHAPTAVKPIKKFKGKAPVDPVSTHEEFEELEELSTDTLQSYRKKARAQGNAIVDKMKMGGGDWSKDQKDTKTLRKRAAGAQMSGKTLRKRGESLATESADMLDTSLSDIDASKTGEVYKKVKEKSTAPAAPTGTATHVVAGKDGEAYNTTGITKRVPAVESAVLEVMAQTMQKRKMFEDAANIAIISQDQRQDWLDVSTGKMDVVDYFNKYKV